MARPRPFLACLRCAAVVACSSLLASVALAGGGRRVPGLDDLVIFNPPGNARGLPPVEFAPAGDGRSVRIDIPPVVHVHRFYYSGDKEYQGPLLSGGPTVVVANSPWSGERMYTDVMLPAGTTVIAYDKCGITYAYPDQRIVITFGRICREKAVVTYLPGRGIRREVDDFRRDLAAHTRESLQKSKLLGTVRDSTEAGGQVTLGAFMGLAWVANTALETAQKLVSTVPGVQALHSLGKQYPQMAENEAVRQAGIRAELATTRVLPNVPGGPVLQTLREDRANALAADAVRQVGVQQAIQAPRFGPTVR